MSSPAYAASEYGPSLPSPLQVSKNKFHNEVVHDRGNPSYPWRVKNEQTNEQTNIRIDKEMESIIA